MPYIIAEPCINSAAGPQGIPRRAAGLILLQTRSFVTGTPVAGLSCHELHAWTDSDSFVLDDRLSRRGVRLQTAADRSDASSGARQPHARGARAGAAADVLAAPHPRPRRRGAAAASPAEETGRVEVDLWRPARQSVGRHA